MATNKKDNPETVHTNPEAGQANTGPATFSKAHILTFKRYANRRDLLSVLLEKDQRYTLADVDAMIKDFSTRKGKVN